jgi:hypothetical protein
MDIYVSRNDIVKLISEAVSIGFRKGLELSGMESKYISKNKAHKIFGKVRVNQWIADGDIKPKYNGNGETSTINLEYSKLLELDASETIKIRKSS